MTPARRLRAVPQPTTTCAVCREPMVWLGWPTHPNCDPAYGIAARGEPGRQMRLDEGGER